MTRTRLADQLGVGVGLAAEHQTATEAARTVLAWLRKVGAVIDDPRDEQIVRRLAAAGRAGAQFPEPLTDEQLRALRDAFEQLSADQRSSLGPDVGRVIVFRYDGRGRLQRSTARPGEVYLSRAVDREPESFAARYSDPRLGPHRARALRSLGTRWTLDDADSPDLRVGCELSGT